MKRRNFIKKSAVASVGTLFVPQFLQSLPKSQLPLQQGKKLVVIQFSGGNDGLNTVVPFQNDLYYKARPQLAIEKNEVLRLSDEMGLNPALKGLRNLYDEGYVNILNSVGYPNPDRSHFRSMDIWHTASDSNEFLSSGWLGRYLDAHCEQPYQAIEVDDTLSLAMKGEKLKGMAVTDPSKLYRTTQDPALSSLVSQSQHHTHEPESNVGYLYKTLLETYSSAEYIHNQSKIYQSTVNYPQDKFARQLKMVAELIVAQSETQVYYVSLSGFDTHVRQKPQQERLLQQYGDAIQAFVKDLKRNNVLDETLILTFSEFGRRVKQNASNGTDHGTANNVFVIGGKLNKAGFYNAAPNLTDLDNGDLKYEIDFRRIYATVLENWLEVKSQTVLGGGFEKLRFI